MTENTQPQLLSESEKWAPVAQEIRKQGLTNFGMMAVINELAGNHRNGGWDAIDAQLKLIQSEFNELKDKGIAARNVKELRDGIADLLVTVYGLAHRAGIDADADFFEVVISNMSKFDPEQPTDDVLKTVAKYAAVGVETVQLMSPDPFADPQDDKMLLVTKSSYDQSGSDGKDYPAGKWLKSHNFEEPVFPALEPFVEFKLGLLGESRVISDTTGENPFTAGDNGDFTEADARAIIEGDDTTGDEPTPVTDSEQV